MNKNKSSQLYVIAIFFISIPSYAVLVIKKYEILFQCAHEMFGGGVCSSGVFFTFINKAIAYLALIGLFLGVILTPIILISASILLYKRKPEAQNGIYLILSRFILIFTLLEQLFFILYCVINF